MELDRAARLVGHGVVWSYCGVFAIIAICLMGGLLLLAAGLITLSPELLLLGVSGIALGALIFFILLKFIIYPDVRPPDTPRAPGLMAPPPPAPSARFVRCPQCGGQVFAGRAYCPHCSAPVR